MSNPEVTRMMSKRLFTVSLSDSLRKAYQMMQERGIRHLPVCDEAGEIVGMLSDRDLQRAMSPHFEFDPKWQAKDFMSWPVKTATESDSIEAITRRMLSEKISAILVVRQMAEVGDLQVRGIITTDDLLRYLLKLLDKDRAGLAVSLDAYLAEMPLSIGNWAS